MKAQFAPRFAPSSPLFRRRLRQTPTLLAILALTALLIAGCRGASGAADTNGAAAPAPDAAAPAPAAVAVSDDFRIRSELIFATRADLSFAVGGEIGAVNARPGDTVAAGDLLASLDTETLSRMERAIAQAEYDLDAANDRLDAALELQSADPLVRSRAANALAQADAALAQAVSSRAQAQVNLDNAQDARDDFQLQYNLNLGAARKAVTDAEAAIDRAQEALSDFADGQSERFANALQAREQAQVALDTAQENLNDFLPNYNENITSLRNRISTTEQELDQANDALNDLDDNHTARLANARQQLARAENDLETAEDNFTAFQLRAIDGTFHSLSDGENFDVIQFRALRAAVDDARQTVQNWKDDIAELEAGPKDFDRAAAANRIAVLEERLARLNRDLADELAGPDQNRQKALDAAVAAAEERLKTANRNLAEAEEGVDRLELARLQAVVDNGRLTLENARNRLSRLDAGPDQAELAVLNQAVAAAEQAIVTSDQAIATARTVRDDLAAGPDDAQIALARSDIARLAVTLQRARQDLDDAVIRAPFDAVVRFVSIAPGDIARVDARVIELVDPSHINILGLVETNYIDRIAEGTPARVSIAALPDRTFDAAVIAVSDRVRTERGIISYPVTFAVTIPPGVAIPPNPGLVTTTVTP